MGSNHGLTAKQLAFADALLSGETQYRSALLAGYSPPSASVTASGLVEKPKIRAYIAQRRQGQIQKSQIGAREVLAELETLAFSNMADYLDLDGQAPRIDLTRATREQLGALSTVKTRTTTRIDPRTKAEEVTTEVTVTKADKLRALELYGRQLGMFAEKHEVEVVDVASRILAARVKRVELRDTEPED